MEYGRLYSMKNKNENGFLDADKFYNLLNKSIVFI